MLAEFLIARRAKRLTSLPDVGHLLDSVSECRERLDRSLLGVIVHAAERIRRGFVRSLWVQLGISHDVVPFWATGLRGRLSPNGVPLRTPEEVTTGEGLVRHALDSTQDVTPQSKRKVAH